MAINPNGALGRLLQRASFKRWSKAARMAPNAELSTLRAQRQHARQLIVPLQELSYVAENRLALPRIGTNTFQRPAGTDWSWRPMAWRTSVAKRGLAPAFNRDKIGEEVTVFHDCKAPEVSLTQHRNLHADDLAAYGMTMEVYHFDGSFLSLVLDLPVAACTGLKKRHILQLAAVIDREAPMNIYARLNVKNGPNTEQILLSLPSDDRETLAEFDLAYTQLNEARAEKIWIDILFENPNMNKITIRDLNICRYPRAEI
ncbi:DUF6478 family protein [Loktanella sp. S4079]|uniref:DUF6478 family protein n=1 Tax=Loktanella sp. S4079 TaxID=579483 RepID=UPI0005F9E7BF|nr:DUF6478 family protein [Loktanella sp. S4079]KJZ19128.1 hypothetical protein TW80_10005 [Loktanella sp. S4079]